MGFDGQALACFLPVASSVIEELPEAGPDPDPDPDPDPVEPDPVEPDPVEQDPVEPDDEPDGEPDPQDDPAPDPQPDPAPEPEEDPDAGLVSCGGDGLVCELPDSLCCVGLAGAQCKEGQCGFLEAPAFCDGPEDCEGGQPCCVGFPQGARCLDACGANDQQLCHDDSDCSGADRCNGCQFPGSPTLTFVCNQGC